MERSDLSFHILALKGCCASFAKIFDFRKGKSSFATFASVLMGIGRLANVVMGRSGPPPLHYQG